MSLRNQGKMIPLLAKGSGRSDEPESDPASIQHSAFEIVVWRIVAISRHSRSPSLILSQLDPPGGPLDCVVAKIREIALPHSADQIEHAVPQT